MIDGMTVDVIAPVLIKHHSSIINRLPHASSRIKR
jgi:hypothetical protein